MADFWIKIEKSTPDKPEIFEIAEILNIDPDAALGKLIRVWCWVDSQSSDGHIKSVTSVLIDRLTMSAGFADAMKAVGWLDDDHVPNFERHLGESAKKRAKDAERKRKSRKETDICHTKSVTKSGLDKIRVDNNSMSIDIDAESKKQSEKKRTDISQIESDIIELYHSKLSACARVMLASYPGSKKQSQLRARIKSHSEHRKLEFWAWYFDQCSKLDYVKNGIGDWKANFDYFVRKEKFTELVERFAS